MQITIYAVYDNMQLQDTIQFFSSEAEAKEQLSENQDAFDEPHMKDYEIHLGEDPSQYGAKICEFINDILLDEIV